MLLVDGHTHLHDNVEIGDFLTSASNNFRYSGQLEKTAKVHAVLCLADFSGAEGFNRLTQVITDNNLVGWEIIETKEEQSIGLTSSSGDTLWLIAGRQIVTRERLEVMALGTTVIISDGQSLSATIEKAEKCGSLPILPWGVGKWLGRRGGMVRSLLDSYTKQLALCDNGGRPWFWFPLLFLTAKRKGIAVISGTDPLRITSDCLRAGSFGLMIKDDIDQSFPAKWIKQMIIEKGITAVKFGKPMNITSFIAKQMMLRKKNRI